MNKLKSKFVWIQFLVILVFINSSPLCNHSNNINAKSRDFIPDNSPNEFISESENNNNSLNSSFQNKSNKVDTINWYMLRNVNWEERKDPIYDIVYMPVFAGSVKQYNGKTILIKGYIVPISDNVYALSKNTYASCFFCGRAGPESVIGITFKNKVGKLKTDMYVSLKGKLKLNDTNPDDWMYQIVNAEIVNIEY
jgi:hypothetical protein